MKCKHCKDLISPYLDKRLFDIERKDIEEHIMSCPECRKRLEETKAAITGVKASPQKPLPPFFMQKMNARLDREMQDAVQKRPWYSLGFSMKVAASVMALLVCVIIAWDTLPHSLNVRQTTGKGSTLKRIDNVEKLNAPIAGMLSEVPLKQRFGTVQSEGGSIGDGQARKDQKSTDGWNVRPQDKVSQLASGLNKERKAEVSPVTSRISESAAYKTKGIAPTQETALGEETRPTDNNSSKEKNIALMAQAPSASLGNEVYGQRSFAQKKASSLVRDKDEHGYNETNFINQWQGYESSISNPIQLVIRDQKDWQKLWARHTRNQGPAAPPPTIDFNRQMVVAIFGGKTRTNDSIVITQILKGKKLTVYYKNVYLPGNVQNNKTRVNQQFNMVVIPRSDAPAVFIPEKSQ